MIPPSRKHPAHGVDVRIDEPTIVFVTACTKDRVPALAQNDIKIALCDIWSRATHWCVGRYVIMPDHVHFFTGMTNESRDLELWMKYWKRLFHSAHSRKDWEWQSGHWDTRMRSAQHYEEKLEYVLNNPVRRGLVARPEDWTYQGEVFPLSWR